MIIREYLMSKNKLNLYDDSKSLFSPDKYSIEVDCDWDKPCCFISSKGKQWKLKVCIDTYEILEIVRNGVITSNNSDEFQNIINKLKEWLTLPSAIPWCTGTNKQAAYEYGFENPFRRIIKYDFCISRSRICFPRKSICNSLQRNASFLLSWICPCEHSVFWE